MSIENRQFIFSRTTNGTLLEKHIDYLVDQEVVLLISLDGDEHSSSYRVKKFDSCRGMLLLLVLRENDLPPRRFAAPLLPEGGEMLTQQKVV